MPVPAAVLQAPARSRASRSTRRTMMRITDGSAHAIPPVPLLGATWTWKREGLERGARA